MRNIWLLLKNYFVCGIGNLRRKNTRTKAVVGISIISVICLAWFAFFTWCMYEMANAVAEYNLQASVLVYGLVISLFLSVIMALQKITGGQKANDTEMLLSMPFKKIEIMVAKALSRFGVNSLIVAMFFLPATIGYLACTPFSISAFMGCLVIMLLIPLMAVGLSYIVDFFATVCFTNSKFGNIAKALFTLLVLIGIVAIYEFFMLNLNSPFMAKAVNWLITFNPWVFLSLIVGVLFMFILGNWLNALLLNRETRTTHAKSIAISTKLTTPFRAILKNETNRYFNSATMMLNTFLGPLIIIGLTIWLLVDRGNTLTSILTATFGITPEVGYLLVAILFAASGILTYPSAFSISLEGKQLWILRSMPIPAHTVLTAKALFNVLLVTPISVVCSVLIGTVLHLSPLIFVALLFIPMLTNILVAYCGVMVNLFFPKLEFESEAAAIKQSMSSMIMMLGGMVLIAGLIALVIFLTGSLPLIAIIAIIIGILLIIDVIALSLTYTLGQRMFNRL